MQLQRVSGEFSVCQYPLTAVLPPLKPFHFLSRTDEELSLVCPTDQVPAGASQRTGQWRGFRIVGVLDFSLVGILAGIAEILAQEKISIFAVSTYNTDYVFVRTAQYAAAERALTERGYAFVDL